MHEMTIQKAALRCLVAALLVAVMLWACVALIGPSEKAPEVAAEAVGTAGTYTATEQGFGGDVVATVEIAADGSITSIALEGAGETPALGGAALPVLQDAMLAAQSAEVDGVSGATVTSNAAKAAVAAALAQG